MTINYNARVVTDGLVACWDAGNPKSYSPNIHPKPTDIYAWVNSSTGNGCNLSRDTIQSPVGKTPLKMDITGADPFTQTYSSSLWNICPTVQGDTWTVSLYIKASQAMTCELWIVEANSSGGYIRAVGNASLTPTITTEWQRFSYSGTVVDASTAYIQWRFDGPNSGYTGSSIWIDGIQIERGLSMTTFNPKYNQNDVNWLNLISNNIAEAVNKPVFNNNYFSFNGTTNNRYFKIPNNTALDTQYPTIEIWVKPANLNQNGHWFEKGTVNAQYSLFQEGSNICFRTKPAGTMDSLYGSATVLSTTNWNHVVASRDPYRKKIYINGVLTYFKNYTDSITTTPDGMSIGVYGGYSGSRSYYYNGDIANIKIYNRALSDSEISQNFNALRGRFGI